MTFVCLLVTLHDCVLLKNFFRFNFRIRYIQTGIAPAFILFCLPGRFRRDCKGRNLSGTSKKLLKFFFFSLSGFRVQLPLNPSFFMAASSGAARPPLRSGAKIETFGTNFQDFCLLFFDIEPNFLYSWRKYFQYTTDTARQHPHIRTISLKTDCG